MIESIYRLSHLNYKHSRSHRRSGYETFPLYGKKTTPYLPLTYPYTFLPEYLWFFMFSPPSFPLSLVFYTHSTSKKNSRFARKPSPFPWGNKKVCSSGDGPCLRQWPIVWTDSFAMLSRLLSRLRLESGSVYRPLGLTTVPFRWMPSASTWTANFLFGLQKLLRNFFRMKFAFLSAFSLEGKRTFIFVDQKV